MVPGILTRAGSGHLDSQAATVSPFQGYPANHHPRSPTHRPLALQRAASAPSCAASHGAATLTAAPIATLSPTQHLTAPLEQAMDHSWAVLQAELSWVKEQLDRERSRSNGTAVHMEQRRIMMELMQQSQLVNKLQGQVSKLEQTLTQAQLTIAQQAKDMTVLGRAQALADWTNYASTRKRYLSSVAEVDAVTSRASQAERALQAEKSSKAQLLQQIQHLKRQNTELQNRRLDLQAEA
ncbi:hypothetical protein WJX74_004662 [Apatococcus lobatus]|uniref:Uncharacterized protein n=2 Tax=Apatococcus TaxID=904362 RepID=A0AAW1SZE0_9CHLO